jgi:phosphoglycolate phosphatase
MQGQPALRDVSPRATETGMRAVLWDLDGTLLPDNIYAPQQAALLAAIEEVYDATDPGIDWVGKTDLGIVREIVAAAGQGYRHRLPEFMDAYIAGFMERVPERIEAQDGARDAIRALDNMSVWSVVVTGNVYPIAKEKLDRAGLTLIDKSEGAYGDDGEKRADLVGRCLLRSGLQPDQVVLVGDTHRDVAAARANHVFAVGLRTPKHPDLEADLVIQGLRELVPALRETERL